MNSKKVGTVEELVAQLDMAEQSFAELNVKLSPEAVAVVNKYRKAVPSNNGKRTRMETFGQAGSRLLVTFDALVTKLNENRGEKDGNPAKS